MGMKQRLGLAMALLADPALMILDEPVNGLDIEGVVEIREIIKRLNCRKAHHVPDFQPHGRGNRKNL